MNIKPLGNRLVVKLTKQKTTSTAGIILSTKEENEQTIGEVITLGKGVDMENELNISKLGLKAGDKVMFGRYGGEEIKDEKDPEIVFKILKSSDVIAVIES